MKYSAQHFHSMSECRGLHSLEIGMFTRAMQPTKNRMANQISRSFGTKPPRSAPLTYPTRRFP